jgi:GNAT superfamily N-acetyltransferase
MQDATSFPRKRESRFSRPRRWKLNGDSRLRGNNTVELAKVQGPRGDQNSRLNPIVKGPSFELDSFPVESELDRLWRAAWGVPLRPGYAEMLQRSLCHGTARDGAGGTLIGFVNVAWDGGVHAFLLDPMVHPDFRRRGIATELVRRVTEAACERGATWLHVDFEPHLEAFYRGCGFAPTRAGLLRLR